MTLQYFARSTNLLYQAASRHPFILYFVNDKERVFYILAQAPCALQVLPGIRRPFFCHPNRADIACAGTPTL